MDRHGGHLRQVKGITRNKAVARWKSRRIALAAGGVTGPTSAPTDAAPRTLGH